MKSKSSLPAIADVNNAFSKLNPAQKLFVKEYIMACGNACRAYRQVYKKATYSSARSLSSRLLRNVDVVNAITAEYKNVWKEKDTEIEKSKTYKLIHAMSNSNIADVVDLENGTLRVKDLKDIPPEAIEAIQSIKRTRKVTAYGIDETLEVKMHPRIPALELRAKLQGMLDSKMDFSGDLTVIPAAREAAIQRIKEVFDEIVE